MRSAHSAAKEGVEGGESAFGTRAKLKEGQSQFGFAPVVQTSTCSAMARASSTSIPRYLMVLSMQAAGALATLDSESKISP